MALFSRICVHAPFGALARIVPLLAAAGVSPEVYLAEADVDAILGGAGKEPAARIAAAGLRATVHLPFWGIDPGAEDEAERRAAAGRLRRSLAAAAVFRPDVVVTHPGGGRGERPSTARIAATVRTWESLLADLPPGLAGSAIALENIYDRGPEGLGVLLAALPAPAFGCCFDTGHFQMFAPRAAGELERWLERLAPWLRATHLHDNAGEADDHLPPGQGVFDFARYFRIVAALPAPIVGTLEMHSEPHVHEGLAALRSHGVL